MHDYLIVALLAMLPISECRGSVIYGLTKGLNPIVVFFISVVFNILIVPVVLKLLEVSKIRKLVYKLLKRNIERKIKQIEKKAEIYEELALLTFVALPFPLTGAYTGALVAYFMEMNFKKSVGAIAIGVIISATIVTLTTLGILSIPKI